MADEGTIEYDSIRRVSHPQIEAVLVAFEFKHLPSELQAISKPFADLAHLHAAAMPGVDPRSPAGYHLAVGLQRLLEAKDAVVRSALFY